VDAFFNRQLAKNEKRRERAFSRDSASKTSVIITHSAEREREKLFSKKKKSKKKAHTLEFLLHKQTNNYSRIPSVYKERRYIYREIERERERLFLSLRFDFSSRNTERDERQISYFFFFSEPPPPAKQKKKRIEKKKKKKKSEERESFFWGDKE